MALRELKKGEKVLMIEACPNGKVGDTVIVLGQRNKNSPTWQCKWNKGEIDKHRESLLAVGDKVTRGPCWDKHYAANAEAMKEVGTVTTLNNSSVRVDWKDGLLIKSGLYIMTPDHQDLKPVGDSEVGEGRPECFGEYQNCDLSCEDCPSHMPDSPICKCFSSECSDKLECMKLTRERGSPVKEPNKPKPIEEKAMTRKQEAVEVDEKIENVRKQKYHDVIAHEENMAQKDERMIELQGEAADLKLYTTKKAKKIATVVRAKNANGAFTSEEQAEAIIWCSDNEITL